MLKSKYNPDKTFTIGILGGGQLAKMIASAAYRLGINVAVIESHSDSPAGDMTKSDFTKGWLETNELDKFIEKSDVITLENEFIDPEILDYISQKRTVYPSPQTMRLVQDKFIQKETFKNAELEVPYFEEINSVDDVFKFGEKKGYPFVIKARKYGYDGYGNATVFNKESAEEAWNKFKTNGKNRDLMAEEFVEFSKELAVIVARNSNDEIEVYPCVETVQYRHICHEVIAPAEISEDLQNKARNLALKAVKSINGIGVFGVEMFLTKTGDVLINEIAPRPHNSGHYTIESCYTSQFENAIRAVCGLPLGSSKMITPASVMINLLGVRDGIGVPTDVSELLRHKKVFLHLYNKKQSRTGRKMGHITSLGMSQTEARAIARSAADSIVW
ncbi:MAG: 5-(carboxyamino)imidazole ribonucleotide synthase [Candidatus Kapabacteria bacterium]|nr:5-(carboxyamino)imidazole ribonucleotide synthase [Ignavibacteriota bacterium]MCW5883456.1 5-(carboxyamino)imidazole ribonucleotide synthase [Candidatus Kapabacteria bacterium]